MKKIFALLIVFSVLFAYTNAQQATKKTLGSSSETKKTEQVKETEKKTINTPTDTKTKDTKAKDTKTSKSTKKAKPIKGTVINFSDFVSGGKGTVTKEVATQLAEKGTPIVFLSGTGKSQKVYFVFNEDGSFAGKNLAKYASNKSVGIIGKTKTVKGINVIIAQSIESMD